MTPAKMREHASDLTQLIDELNPGVNGDLITPLRLGLKYSISSLRQARDYLLLVAVIIDEDSESKRA